MLAEHGSHSGADKPGTVVSGPTCLNSRGLIAQSHCGCGSDPDKGKQVALQEEFVTLLSQQLASQQQYYHQQLRRLERDDAIMVQLCDACMPACKPSGPLDCRLTGQVL